MRRRGGIVVAVLLVAAVALADRYQKSSGSSALADGCVQASSGNLTSTGQACGSGGSAHTIKDEGTGLTQRSGLNFVGAGVTCADDAGNNETDCTVSGGGASALNDLTDATITTPATGATLIYDGTVWIDGALDLADGDARTGTLAVGNGGTGLTSGTSGGVLAFTGSTTVTSSGALTAGGLVVGGGAGAVPTALGVQSNGQIPIGDGSGGAVAGDDHGHGQSDHGDEWRWDDHARGRLGNDDGLRAVHDHAVVGCACRRHRQLQHQRHLVQDRRPDRHLPVRGRRNQRLAGVVLMRWLALALLLVPTLASADWTPGSCTDGTNCLCDSLSGDASVIWCEDFEDASYDDGGAGWGDVYRMYPGPIKGGTNPTCAKGGNSANDYAEGHRCVRRR